MKARTNTTTTADTPTSVLVSITRDGDSYYVKDYIGLRYGSGDTPGAALEEWWLQVKDLLCVEEPTAPPLAHEIGRYRSALAETEA